MKLVLKMLPAGLRGIYKVKGVAGRMPERALKLEPMAADALMALEAATGGLVYSDIWRSAEASLLAVSSKAGVQPPGFSGHNFGLSVDVAVDDYVPPGSVAGTPKEKGTLSLRGWTYAELLAEMASRGWYCHRRDGARGFEDWHFNFFGVANAGRYLEAAKTKASAGVELRIMDAYADDFALDASAMQAALLKLGLYRGEVDGMAGPLTREAVHAFQRAWRLPEGAADARTLRTLAFVSAEVVMT